MKTSPELLTDMLHVLGAISTKIDGISAKSGKGGGLGVSGVLGSLIKGKKAGDGISAMADSVKKLNTELKKVDIKKLDKLITSVERYNEIQKEKSYKREKIHGLAASAKDMGMALILTAGGVAAFAGAIWLAEAKLKMTPWAVLGFIATTMVVLAFAMIVIAGADAAGTKMGRKTGLAGLIAPPGHKGRGKEATKSAKDMGIALMIIAGGILSFAVVLMLVPKALGIDAKGAAAPLLGMAVIFGVVAAIGGIFFLLGKLGKQIGIGILVAVGVAIGMAAIGWSVMQLANTAKQLQEFGKDGTATKKYGKHAGDTKGVFGQMMAAIGPGLGMVGLVFVSATALFATLGLIATAGTMGIGALAIGAGIAIAIGVAAALIKVAESVREVNNVTKEIGGVKAMQDISTTIEIMIGAVTTSVIKGVMGGSGVDADGDGGLSLKEIRRFRRIKRIVRMVGNISSSLSKFAEGLKAFATVGEISSLEYKEEEIKDKDGAVVGTKMTPVIGGTKIHVTVIAKAIADTFGLFVKTMVANTEKMHIGQGAALKRMAKALSGSGGLISGISEFAQALKTFSQFGALQEIWVPAQYENPDEPDIKKRKIVAGTGVSVKIDTIVTSITGAFGTFVEKMANTASKFEIGGAIGKKMTRFTEALMGKKRSGVGKWFASDKPGILTAITAFSETLTLYAQYGREGLVPVIDPKTGEVIDKMTMTDIAKTMVKSISDFVTGFESAAAAENLETKATAVQDKITSITNIVTQFDVLAKTGESVDKLANSLGLLATNIGLLVTNTSALDTAKLQSLATITAQHAVTTKGVPIAPTTSKAISSSTTTGGQQNWDEIADRMGQIIADKLNFSGGMFKFEFGPNGAEGNMMYIKP